MMMGNPGRSWLIAGIVGAAAGIYIMNKIDGTKMEKRLKYRGRKWMLGMRHSYRMGRNMLTQRIARMLQ